jgi:hypothetical protein
VEQHSIDKGMQRLTVTRTEKGVFLIVANRGIEGVEADRTASIRLDATELRWLSDVTGMLDRGDTTCG